MNTELDRYFKLYDVFSIFLQTSLDESVLYFMTGMETNLKFTLIKLKLLEELILNASHCPLPEKFKISSEDLCDSILKDLKNYMDFILKDLDIYNAERLKFIEKLLISN